MDARARLTAALRCAASAACSAPVSGSDPWPDIPTCHVSDLMLPTIDRGLGANFKTFGLSGVAPTLQAAGPVPVMGTNAVAAMQQDHSRERAAALGKEQPRCPAAPRGANCGRREDRLLPARARHPQACVQSVGIDAIESIACSLLVETVS
jgi:hypothetical protein